MRCQHIEHLISYSYCISFLALDQLNTRHHILPQTSTPHTSLLLSALQSLVMQLDLKNQALIFLSSEKFSTMV